MNNNNADNSSKTNIPYSNNKTTPITVLKRQNKRGNYLLGETIGQGAFAKVKLATHIYTQEKVAIKILNKSKLSDQCKDVLRIQKEISILKRLRHKNIIQLYEIMESESTLYIVMDYCEGKELFDYIIKRKRLTEREACRFFQQIINGVEYLHLQNITHRDLKPENLLLDSKKRIKISDFGLSNSSERMDSLLQTPCGTPSYAPPEMLLGDEYNGVTSDIWSCGIILYTMLCGNLPCADSKEELIYQCFMNKSYEYPSYLSNSALDLLDKLLKFNPLERIRFEQIKRHPWFNIVKTQLKPGIIVNVHKIPIDEDILKRVEDFGYDKEKCRESLSLNRYDHLCSIYYFILKKFTREGRTSISDMYSEEYESYIRDVSNWANREDVSNEIYKDYFNGKKLSRNKPQMMPLCTEGNMTMLSKINIIDVSMGMGLGMQSVNQSYNGNKTMETFFKKQYDEESRKNSSIILDYGDMSMNSMQSYNTMNGKSKQITYTAKTNEKQKQKQKEKQKRITIERQSYKKIMLDNKQKEDSINILEDIEDKLNDVQREEYKSSLKKLNVKYKNDIRMIDKEQHGEDDYNVISMMAKKLIGSTMFSKYLFNKKAKKGLGQYNNNNIKLVGKSDMKDKEKIELEEKFYLVQKFRNLIEIVKTKHKGIFPKKINDWNYNSLEKYLYDDDDFVFEDSFQKTNFNQKFLAKILNTTKHSQNSSSKKYLSKSLTYQRYSLFKYGHLSSSIKSISSYKSSINSHRNSKRIQISNTSFIQDGSIDKSCNDTNNQSWVQRLNNQSALISKYSTSTMNYISEDDELIEMYYSPKKVIVYNNKKVSNSKNQEQSFGDSLIQSDIRSRNKFNDSIIGESIVRNNQTVSNFNVNEIETRSGKSKGKGTITCLRKKKRNVQNIPVDPLVDDSPSRNIKFKNRILQSNKDQLKSIDTEHDLLSVIPYHSTQPSTSTFRVHTASNVINNQHQYYDGPIDFSCAFTSVKEMIIPLLQQYFKKINYFCTIASNDVIKCSKANISLEIEILSLKSISPLSSSSISYLKIKHKTGEKSAFSKVVRGLLESLQVLNL